MARMNLLCQIMGVFQRKKAPCDDIVTAADKVIEKYIFNRRSFIKKKYKAPPQIPVLLVVLSAVIIGAVAVLFIL